MGVRVVLSPKMLHIHKINNSAEKLLVSHRLRFWLVFLLARYFQSLSK